MVDDFILRKKGQQKIDYFHPDLQQCLEPTYGVIVYQEQVMQIAQIIAGYTLGGAGPAATGDGQEEGRGDGAAARDLQRGREEEGPRPRSRDAALRPDGEVRGVRLQQVAHRRLRGGHVPHRVAEGALPAEFHGATLSSDMDDTDKVQVFVKDAQDNKVAVLGPDITARSTASTRSTRGRSATGLGGIKGTGEGAVQEILRAREARPFADLFDFCARVDRRVVNRRTIEALVRAGAFDALDADRAKLLAKRRAGDGGRRPGRGEREPVEPLRR